MVLPNPNSLFHLFVASHLHWMNTAVSRFLAPYTFLNSSLHLRFGPGTP